MKGGDRFEQGVASHDGLFWICVDAVRGPRLLEQAATRRFVTLMPGAHVALHYRAGIHRGTVHLARTAEIARTRDCQPRPWVALTPTRARVDLTHGRNVVGDVGKFKN